MLKVLGEVKSFLRKQKLFQEVKNNIPMVKSFGIVDSYILKTTTHITTINGKYKQKGPKRKMVAISRLSLSKALYFSMGTGFSHRSSPGAPQGRGPRNG